MSNPENVGAVVELNGKKRYKTHRILAFDGSESLFERKIRAYRCWRVIRFGKAGVSCQL